MRHRPVASVWLSAGYTAHTWLATGVVGNQQRLWQRRSKLHQEFKVCSASHAAGVGAANIYICSCVRPRHCYLVVMNTTDEAHCGYSCQLCNITRLNSVWLAVCMGLHCVTTCVHNGHWLKRFQCGHHDGLVTPKSRLTRSTSCCDTATILMLHGNTVTILTLHSRTTAITGRCHTGVVQHPMVHKHAISIPRRAWQHTTTVITYIHAIAVKSAIT